MQRSLEATFGLGARETRTRERSRALLLACYAVAGFAWWSMLGCPLQLPHGGLDLQIVAPEGSGAQIFTACEAVNASGQVVGECGAETGLVTDETASRYCLSAEPTAIFGSWGADCDCAQQPGQFTGGCGAPNQCETVAIIGTVQRCTALFCEQVAHLEIDIGGSGLSTVSIDDPPQTCHGGGCVTSYCVADPPTLVSLTPQASAYELFIGWEGDGCAEGVVEMDVDRHCTARFGQPLLTVVVAGPGAVRGPGTFNAPQIQCREGGSDAECEAALAKDLLVTLTATPDSGAILVGWSGDCSGTEPTTSFPMSGDATCSATFAPAPPPGVDLVSLADDESYGNGQVDENGSFAGNADLSVVAFVSGSTNLVATPEAPGGAYSRDLAAGTTSLIKEAGPFFGIPPRLSLSADGLLAAYEHTFNDPLTMVTLTQVYRRDLRTGHELLISVYDPVAEVGFDPDGQGFKPVISGNGRFVAYEAGLAAGAYGIAVRDTCNGAPPAERCVPRSAPVSFDPGGGLALYATGPRISHDGRYVLFFAIRQGGDQELLLHDRDPDGNGVFDEGNGATIVATPDPTGGALSFVTDATYQLDASGRYVAFESNDPDLPSGGGAGTAGQIYRRDTCPTGSTSCVPGYTVLSIHADGLPRPPTAFFSSQLADLGGSGRYVLFSSGDASMVSDPSSFEGLQGGVLRDTCLGAPPGCVAGNRFVPRRGDGSPILPAILPRISDDGAKVVFAARRADAIPELPLPENPFFLDAAITPTGVAPEPGVTPSVSGPPNAPNPASVPAGSPEFLLTIQGNGFVPGVRVRWGANGPLREAIFVSPKKLQLRVPAQDVATPAAVHVRVVNPSGLESSLFAFIVSVPPVCAQFADLEVKIVGAGTVSIGDPPQVCPGGTCLSSYCVADPPTLVSLTARPGFGKIFAGWEGEGCASGVVAMDENRTCTARFRQPTLQVVTTGSGHVFGPGAILCSEGGSPAECEASLPSGSEVTLTAIPDNLALFLGWSGACTGGELEATFLLSGDAICTASFGPANPSGLGAQEIVSVADDESLGDDGVSTAAHLTTGLAGDADLSVVAFQSRATNLTGTPEATHHTYARDRVAETTRRITGPEVPDPGNLPRFSLSADGLFAVYERAFEDPTHGSVNEVRRRDLRTGDDILVSVHDPVAQVGLAPGQGFESVISGNGRFVAYQTRLPGGASGIAVRDTCSGAALESLCMPTSVAIDSDPDGNPIVFGRAPRISHDGRYVLFFGQRPSGDTELLLHDRDSDEDGTFDEDDGVTIVATPDPTGGPLSAVDTNLHHLDASGRYVAFHSSDPDLPQNGPLGLAYARDTCAGASAPCAPSYTLLSVRADGTPQPGTSTSYLTDLGGSARYAMFWTSDPGMVAGADPTSFAFMSVLRDTCIGAPSGCVPANTRVSLASDGSSLGTTEGPRVSDDGSVAIFFGPRSAVVSDPNGFLSEVLAAETGITPEAGGLPSVTGLTPDKVPAGSPELLVTITGANFVPGARVSWDGESETREAIFVSPERLQLRVPASDLATQGVVLLNVVNPSGLASNLVPFTRT